MAHYLQTLFEIDDKDIKIFLFILNYKLEFLGVLLAWIIGVWIKLWIEFHQKN